MKRVSRVVLKAQLAVLLVALAIPPSACASPEVERPDYDGAAIRAEVEAWLEDFWAAWNEGGKGFDRAVANFSSRSDFLVVSESMIWRSHAEWVDGMRPALERIDHQVHAMDPPVIRVISSDYVWVAQTGTWHATYVDGTVSDTIRFAHSALLNKGPDDWKVVGGHESF